MSCSPTVASARPSSAQLQTGPARERARAGPSGTGKPSTRTWTTTSTTSAPGMTSHETSSARCPRSSPAARPHPPSGSSSIRSAAASAARSAAESARCRAATTAPIMRLTRNATQPSIARDTSQMLAEPRSGGPRRPPRHAPGRELTRHLPSVH